MFGLSLLGRKRAARVRKRKARTWEDVQRLEQRVIRKSRPDLRGYAGLAFSGGGIRSATFNLGVIQALASARLLGKFDYLSTVSGGGYIGSWLTSLVHRADECNAGDPPRITDELEDALAFTADGMAKGHAKPHQDCPKYVREAVEHLRTFSNYLTPRPGLLGLDTLTGAAIYLRNLVLNFALILMPAVAFFLLLDRFTVWAASLGKSGPPLAAAGLLLAATSILIGLLLAPKPVLNARSAIACSDGSTMLTAACALLFCVATTVWFWKAAPIFHEAPLHLRAGYGALASLVLWLLTIVVRFVSAYGPQLRIVARQPIRRLAAAARAVDKPWDKDDRLLTVRVFVGLLAGAIVSGAAGGVLLGCVFDLVQVMTGNGGVPDPLWGLLARLRVFCVEAGPAVVGWLIVALVPAIIMNVLAIMFALQVAIARRGMSVHDTEVLGRLGGAVMLLTGLWVVSFALAGFAAATLDSIDWVAAAGGLTWLVTTLAGVFLGKSAATDAKAVPTRLDRVAVLLPHAFIAGFMVFSAVLASWIAEALAVPAPFEPHGWAEWVSHYTDAAASARHAVCWTLSTLAAAAVVLAFTIDINFFSYHLFYRNRLARCYLGASRWAIGKWRPSRITGLDPDDDVRLKDLATPGGGQRPYHIVNTALNLTRPADTAWLQRKAAPFVFTPLFCGYSMPGTGGFGERTFYRRTKCYLGDAGPKLSHALTISGAAASPNMGYHSSPAMAFLLTVFNVRLGSWCGNPNKRPAWRQRSPRFAYFYLFAELMGRTDETKPFVYLSDGGHFDNLGIYELVRRRCKLIVACDAGADPRYELEDLANAIEKCELDFGARFDRMGLKKFAPRSAPFPGAVAATRQCSAQFAVSRIHYADDTEGTFVYVKSSICGDEPADILHYAAAHPLFPHESTGDQWFDEQQFESYRKLGFRAASAASRSIDAACAGL